METTAPASRSNPVPEADRSMDTRPRYVVVVNTNAGGSGRFDATALEAAMPEASFEVVESVPQDLDVAFAKAFSDKPFAVIVIGGDGTARAAASRAVETGVPMIPMPGGTMNVLPKIVFGHGDMARAISDLPNLQPRTLDVARVGGEMFFLSAAFGLAGPMARLREATRSHSRFKRICTAAVTLLRSIGPSLRSRVRWRTTSAKWSRSHSLVVAIGDLDRVLAPDTEDHGHRFEVVALDLRSVWQMLSFGAAFLTGGWRNSPRLRTVRAKKVEVKVRGRRPLVVLDGEPMRLSRVSDITLQLGALPVLAMPPENTAT